MDDYSCCHFCFHKGLKDGKPYCYYPGSEHEIKFDYREWCVDFERL